MYLLSRWYTRKVKTRFYHIVSAGEFDMFQELAFRSAILYTGLLMSNAFGSVRHLWVFLDLHNHVTTS